MRYVISGMALMMLLTVSCCKKPVEKPTDTGKGITILFKPMWDGQDLVFNSKSYTKPDKEVMTYTNWAWIISKLALVKTDNSEVLLGDGYQYIEFKAGRVKFNYAAAPAGDYKAITFQLGLDSAINHGDPNIWPSDHPLNANLTGLHWGWAGGYIFQAMDGIWFDSATSSNQKAFSFHTATDPFKRKFTLPMNFTLQADGMKTATIEVWADEFFKTPNSLSLSAGAMSHTLGSTEIALMQKIIDNSAEVYKLKSVQ
ncbi:MAG: hypothetical protein JNL57_00415 [Bacteroidetes bacterium]|nr:hypothetical protein [Bacteroidota bacterium]